MKPVSLKDNAPGARPDQRAGGTAIGLRLYVAGFTPNSQRARANLQAVLLGIREHRKVELEIVDVLADARRAVADNVFVTPTLLVLTGAKPQVMIGNLSDTASLEAFLSDLLVSTT